MAPKSLAALTLSEWDKLLPEARAAGLLSRIEVLTREYDLSGYIPPQTKPHLLAARRIADNENRMLTWELHQISRALSAFDGPIILLKGAAYLLRKLPNARGRLSSDVDILVSKNSLSRVEGALLSHGWEHIKLENYDQLFYRRWSHELPPLQHKDRGTVVDVHHTILPLMGRLHPDPEKLLAASIPVSGTRFRTLAAADMVLHCAAHAFQDGDLRRALRDLVDIDDLLRHFSQSDRFWSELMSRAEELNLSRPLYYALRYASLYLETPIPKDVIVYSKHWRPAWPTWMIMDALVQDVITARPWRKDLTVSLSKQLLYIRAHWLRMPPYLLIPHLARKALRKRGLQETS